MNKGCDGDSDIDILRCFSYCGYIFLNINTFLTQSFLYLFKRGKHYIRLHFSVCNKCHFLIWLHRKVQLLRVLWPSLGERWYIIQINSKVFYYLRPKILVDCVFIVGLVDVS